MTILYNQKFVLSQILYTRNFLAIIRSLDILISVKKQRVSYQQLEVAFHCVLVLSKSRSYRNVTCNAVDHLAH